MKIRIALFGVAGLVMLGAGAAYKPVRQRLQNGNLDAAIRKRDANAASMLYLDGARPLSPQRRDELLFLAANSNPIILKRLLDDGAEPDAVNSDGNPLLDVAERWDCARIVLQKGADIEKRNRAGDTPLHWAIRLGSFG